MEVVRGMRGDGVGAWARKWAQKWSQKWSSARTLCLLACVSASALAQPAQRVTTYEYHDDTQRWVLGQVQRITVNGIETERTGFNAQALPEQYFVFG